MALEFLDSPFFTSQSDEGFLENIKQGDYPGYLQNLGEGLRDEFAAVDDLRRFLKYAAQGDFLKASRSLSAAQFELGSSVASFFGPGVLLKGLTKVPKLGSMALKVGSKGGKLSKGLRVLKPLTLEEQAAARLARAGGARARFFGAPRITPATNLVGRNIDMAAPAPARGRLSQIVRKLPIRPQELGMSRGGYGGSLARGVLQLAGVTPTAQGPLARRAFNITNATAPGELPVIPLSARVGRGLSGRLGIPFQRAERDELAQLLPGVGSPNELTPLEQALLEYLYNSPGAAY